MARRVQKARAGKHRAGGKSDNASSRGNYRSAASTNRAKMERRIRSEEKRRQARLQQIRGKSKTAPLPNPVMDAWEERELRQRETAAEAARQHSRTARTRRDLIQTRSHVARPLAVHRTVRGLRAQ